MKILYIILLALQHALSATAQSMTSTSAMSSSSSQTTSGSTTPAPASPSTTTLTIPMNVTSGEPYTVTPLDVYCDTTNLLLFCTDVAACNGYYGNVFYSYGSNFFGSVYGRGNATFETRSTNFMSTQSCTLVSSSSYYSCVGGYTTSTFINSTFVNISTTTSTFTWPTANVITTGLPVSTSLAALNATASCTKSAGVRAVDATFMQALGALFGTVLLGLLV